ncbi:flagellar hook protein FlgE [Methylococcaceae bacterium]|nr:flagellar hook protein FlgE [Methylococcaceae bacterium]
MGFTTALSGLKAASTTLAVTSNNIANSQTVGFKESRAQFGDAYANSMGSSNGAVGKGVSITTIAQQFKQGNIEPTGNALDMALSGEGFFSMGDLFDPIDQNKPLEATSFTRNGAFHLNNKGNVVDDSGRYLLAFKPVGRTVAEGFNVGVKLPLNVSTDQGAPEPTKLIQMKINLNGASKVPSQPFGFTRDVPPVPDPTTYNHTTSITTYDSLGNAHVVGSYFVKLPSTDAASANQWSVYTFIDGRGITKGTQSNSTTPTVIATGSVLGAAYNPSTPETAPELPTAEIMSFNLDGSIMTGAGPDKITGIVGQDPITHSGTSVDFGGVDVYDLMTKLDPAGVALYPTVATVPLNITIDFKGTTDFSNPFTVNDLKQDGMPVGNLIGIDVNQEGVVFAKYSNGFAKPLGQVALARFADNMAMTKVGNTTWQATTASGSPIYGAGGDNNFGTVKGSSLETSNVDLSEQLVKLIVAQQAYQANSQIVSAEKSVMETILRV